jgi:hypothetical protein
MAMVLMPWERGLFRIMQDEERVNGGILGIESPLNKYYVHGILGQLKSRTATKLISVNANTSKK